MSRVFFAVVVHFFEFLPLNSYFLRTFAGDSDEYTGVRRYICPSAAGVGSG